MTRDALVKVEQEVGVGHVAIDRALRRIAVAQAALDADEAHWLRLADQQKIWPKLGYVHALEYLEDVFGYSPRTAMERLRVARELGELPRLEDALRCGEMSWSVARELTRVATPDTIERWINDARGQRLRDVEQMVAGRKKGDAPDAPSDPARVKQRLVLELDGESFAIWRQMQQAVEIELGEKLDDRAFVLTLGTRILNDNTTCHDDSTEIEQEIDDEIDVVTDVSFDALPPADQPSGSRARARSKPTVRKVLARYMIHVMTCRGCGGAWQDGAGVRVQVNRSVLERAQCHAIVCDDENDKRPTRTIPAPIERLVLERAQHRCQVPGCRSSKHLTIHHIVFWSHGGTHDPSNLIVLCDGHHRLLHDGLLRITGRMPDDVVFERNGVRLASEASVSPLAPKSEGHVVRKHGRDVKRAMVTPNLNDDEPAVLAQAALRQMGFKAAIAAAAVETACAHVGTDAELSALIKEALQHCR